MSLLRALFVSDIVNIKDLTNKIQNDKTNLLYLFFPMLSGYLTASFCPMKSNSGSNVKFRPPAYVFGIVWPILYLMLGSAWIFSKERTMFYLLFSLLLSSWIVMFSCLKNKKKASWILLANVTMCIALMVVSKKQSQLLLTPLLGWLLFALLMNVVDVQIS